MDYLIKGKDLDCTIEKGDKLRFIFKGFDDIGRDLIYATPEGLQQEYAEKLLRRGVGGSTALEDEKSLCDFVVSFIKSVGLELIVSLRAIDIVRGDKVRDLDFYMQLDPEGPTNCLGIWTVLEGGDE